MSTFIIHYPNGTTSSGTKINEVITCHSIETLKTSLLKIVTLDNYSNIQIIEIDHGVSSIYTFDDDASHIRSERNSIKTSEIEDKLYPDTNKYLVLYDDSCQVYDYDGLKEALLLLRDIPPNWKVISQPDCIVFTYNPQLNLLESSNKLIVLPAELTAHLVSEYKLVVYYYNNLDDPATSHYTEINSVNISGKESCTTMSDYLSRVAISQIIHNKILDYKNLYRINILCNDEKIGEINEVGLYYKENLLAAILSEPFESLKCIMKNIKETVEMNKDPRSHILNKLRKMKNVAETCGDKEKLKELLKDLNKIKL